MNRGSTGRYEDTAIGGEAVRAFVPAPLPPDPPLDLGGPLQVLLEAAVHAVGQLDGVSTLLPDRSLFLYAYARKEAVLSSQIEGTQSSLSDLLLFELEEAPGVPLDDVAEVSSYVAALDHGVALLRSGRPLANRLIREVHEVLLRGGRGASKSPGEFRRSQVWIGGTRPGNAVFVPPPHGEVADCVADLERFVNATDDGVSALVRAGLVHVQFETIHPFLDGNGRVGRMLIVLQLLQSGLLREPLLYLSLYFKRHRETYYELLDRVRRVGDWEAWLEFFLVGVREVSEGAVATARELVDLFAGDRDRVEGRGRRAGSALRTLDALSKRPIASLSHLEAATGLSFPTVSSSMELLVELGIARELTGQRRNRLFAYDHYLATLAMGTEPI